MARSSKLHGPASGRRVLSVLVVMTLVAAGCGGSGESESSADAVTAVTTSAPPLEAELVDDIVDALNKEARIERPEDQFRCVAEAAVAAVGADRLIAAGAPAPGTFDGTLLDAAGQAALLEQVEACIDVGSLLTDADVVGVTVSSEAVARVADGIEGAGLFETFVRAAAASGPEQAIADNIVPIIETLSGCLTIPEVADIVDALGLSSFLPGS